MMNLKHYWHIKENELIAELKTYNYDNKKTINIFELLRNYAQIDKIELPYYILKNPTYDQIMSKNAENKEFLIYLHEIFALYFSGDKEIIVEI